MTAVEVLASELFRLTEQGVRTPCQGADEWTSDHAEDRAQAATWCAGCLVLAECGAAADEQGEKHHVWAGVDRTTTATKTTTKTTTKGSNHE